MGLFSIDLRGLIATKFSTDVLWNVGSIGMLGLTGIIVNLIIARYAGYEALGVFSQVFIVYIFASQLATAGIHYSILKNISEHQNQPETCREIVAAGIQLALIPSVAICVAVYFFVSSVVGSIVNSAAVADGLQTIAPALLLFPLNKLLLMTLNGLRHMRAFAVFQAARFVTVLIAVVILIALGYPARELPASFVFAETIVVAALLIYICGRCFVPPLLAVSTRWLSAHIAYAKRSFPGGFLSEANTRIDILILGIFLSDSLVGIYSFAAMLAEGLAQLPYVVRQNLDPLLATRLTKRKTTETEMLVRKVRRVFWPSMALLGLLSILIYPLIIVFLVGDSEFGRGWTVYTILAVGVIVGAGYRPFLGLFLQGGAPGTNTMLMATLVALNIVLNVALIPLLGVYGAAIATAGAMVAECALIVWLARRCFGIRV